MRDRTCPEFLSTCTYTDKRGVIINPFWLKREVMHVVHEKDDEHLTPSHLSHHNGPLSSLPLKWPQFTRIRVQTLFNFLGAENHDQIFLTSPRLFGKSHWTRTHLRYINGLSPFCPGLLFFWLTSVFGDISVSEKKKRETGTSQGTWRASPTTIIIRRQ